MLLSYLDDIQAMPQGTRDETGYAGPFDINPKTEGLHKTYVAFEGDAEFEPCKSEEIRLRVFSDLVGTHITIEAIEEITPVSGDVPLTIRVKGIAYGIASDGRRIPPDYSLPLDLMVFDSTSTKRLQPVQRVMSNPDGTYAFNYTFTKSGSYRLFVNFLGDNKYASDWSNNGQTTQIEVLEGGELPLSFEKTVTEVVAGKTSRNYKFIRAEQEPDPPTGYERAAEWDLDFGILGKYWAFRATA